MSEFIRGDGNRAVGVATSTWYRPSLDDGRRRHLGPLPKPIGDEVAKGVMMISTYKPLPGYKRLAVMS